MEEIKKNIFQKIQEARCRLQNLSLSKSGKNTHMGYSYYELGDILPAINNINNELGLCTHVTFDKEYARLFVYNSDTATGDIDRIEFMSPLSSSALKNAHPIQNLGATQTYQRRYLYMSAYEIVEHDAVDSSKGKGPKVAMNENTLKMYVETIKACETVESIKEVWASANETHLPSKEFQDACSLKKQEIEKGVECE